MMNKEKQALFTVMAGVLCIAFVGSCASKAKSSARSPAGVTNKTMSGPATPTTRPEAKHKIQHDEISTLFKQIQQWDKAGSGVEAAHKVCTAPEPKTAPCRDVCGLKESICANATRICDIAKGIPDDGWAQAKCTSAKAACGRATKRCCGCVGAER